MIIEADGQRITITAAATKTIAAIAEVVRRIMRASVFSGP